METRWTWGSRLPTWTPWARLPGRLKCDDVAHGMFIYDHLIFDNVVARVAHVNDAESCAVWALTMLPQEKLTRKQLLNDARVERKHNSADEVFCVVELRCFIGFFLPYPVFTDGRKSND